MESVRPSTPCVLSLCSYTSPTASLLYCDQTVHWDSYSANLIWRLQSTRVHVTYCQLQMHLYQGFIRHTRTPTSTISQNLVYLPGGSPSYLVPEAFAALSTCTQATVSNARTLENSLCQIRKGTHAALMDDIPALISAAVMTGIITITLKIGRHIPGHMDAPFPPHGDNSGFISKSNERYIDTIDMLLEEGCLSVCIEYLESFQDRYVMLAFCEDLV